MRLRFSLLVPLLVPLLAAAPPSAAQTPTVRDGWYLGGGADALRFAHVAVSDAEPGAAAKVRPSGRTALHLAIGRTIGSWDVSLEANWAEGHIEVGNDVLSVRDLTSDVTRYRLSLAMGHRLTELGVNRLGLELAPTVDLWSVAGENRVRGGAEVRGLLVVPLGAIDLENRIGLGFSGSPIDGVVDLGDVAEERGLWTFLVGMGLRAGL
jgi:hypothetical protein